MDARKCIAYLTIELRGKIPEEFREPIGWQVYGCDICQDVCPYNRKAPVTAAKQFEPRGENNECSLLQPKLEWLVEMSEEEFRARFKDSAMKRTKWAGLVRNACIALGNARDKLRGEESTRIKDALGRRAESEISSIAESAQWALRRIEEEAS